MQHIEITTRRVISDQPLSTDKKSGWPDGAYVLRVIEVQEPRLTRAGNIARRVDFCIDGTDKMLYWFMPKSKGAQWTWNDVVDSWDDLPNLAGRTFLMECRNEGPWKGKWRLRPIGWLAELVN